MLRFANPWWLLGLGLIPLYLLYQFKWIRRRKLRLPFNRLDLLRRIQGEGKLWESSSHPQSPHSDQSGSGYCPPRWGRGERDISRKEWISSWRWISADRCWRWILPQQPRVKRCVAKTSLKSVPMTALVWCFSEYASPKAR